MSPLVIEGPVPGGAITQSHIVQNWPGELEISGFDLMGKIHKQAESCGAQFLKEEVISVDFTRRPFIINTQDMMDPSKTHKIKAESCVIALGSTPKFLGVPGESEEDGYWLNGVYNCAACDGALFKDKVVAVVGGGDGAIVEAHYLSRIAKKVYLIVRKDGFKTVEEVRKREVLSKPNIEVRYLTTIEEIKGDGNKMTHLVLKNKATLETLPVDGLFLAIGSKPNTDLFQGQLELDKLGYIIYKGDVQTSVPGVFVVGDMKDRIYRQGVSAAADGMKAVRQAEEFLAVAPIQEESLLRTISNKVTFASDAGAHVLKVSNADQFEKEIKEGSMPSFVDFSATWCGPCKLLKPGFEAKAHALSGKVRCYLVDVDQFSNLSNRYDIRSLPTMLIFNREGKMISRLVGPKAILNFLGDTARALQNSSPNEVDLYLQNHTKGGKPKKH